MNVDHIGCGIVSELCVSFASLREPGITMWGSRKGHAKLAEKTLTIWFGRKSSKLSHN